MSWIIPALLARGYVSARENIAELEHEAKMKKLEAQYEMSKYKMAAATRNTPQASPIFKCGTCNGQIESGAHLCTECGIRLDWGDPSKTVSLNK